MPRIKCPDCGRPIAAGPVAGHPSKCRVWRHDPPDMRTRYSGSLVSCGASLRIVDSPAAVHQLEFEVSGLGAGPDAELDTEHRDLIALF